MNPPNAGERKMLPKIAIHGLQMVSPLGGWPLPGAVPLARGAMLGNGGGPAAGTDMGIAGAASGRGGGFDPEGVLEGSDGFVTGSVDFSVEFDGAAAAAPDARNSGIGCHEDFVSFQARSAELKLPSAILSRMADSEKRPASWPFR